MKNIALVILLVYAQHAAAQLDSIKTGKGVLTEAEKLKVKNNIYEKSGFRPQEFLKAEKAAANPDPELKTAMDLILENNMQMRVQGITVGVQTAAITAIGAEPDLEPAVTPAKSKRPKGPSRFDSRVELRQFDLSEPWQQHVFTNAASVGLVVQKQNLYPFKDSLFQLGTELTLEKKYRLCPGEAFAQQPVAGEGTAFIIQGGKFMTAGHVFTGPLDQYAIVFGFEIISKEGAFESLISVSNIYYPKKIVVQDDALDIAIIEADRVPERPALNIPAKDASLREEIYMIGYPSGLPIKVALNARVTSFEQQCFYTSLDAFQGNSGSPVFSMNTHEVVGILVAGQNDFKWTGSCNINNFCVIPFCKGEKAVRISEAIKLTN